ncbi:MAG: response regulator [Syntrophobacteraceae bacterium]
MKGRILYIEDNEKNLYLITYLLEKNGYEVFQARDGPEGIEAAILHKPDMILLDIQLSSMDGHAVARVLRTNPDMILIPIVAVTSYAMVGDREKAFSAGCSGFIEKPINPDTFMAQIEEYLLRGVTLTE